MAEALQQTQHIISTIQHSLWLYCVWQRPCSKQNISSAQYNIHYGYIVYGRRPAAIRAYHQHNTTFIIVILWMEVAMQQTEHIISTIQYLY